MTKILIKERALTMRRRGSSINSIANSLSVSKSTVSGWCRDISLTKTQINKIAKESKHNATRALLKSAERQRELRKIAMTEARVLGRKDIGTVNKRDIFMVGLGLYWGEGYKKGSQELGFTNSDPLMIRFYIKWLEVCFGIKKTDLILRVSINSIHSHRVNQVESYWSSLLSIQRTQFTMTSLIQSISKKYKENQNHYGTLRVKVRRGTQLRRRILGAIEALTAIK
jgi:predicted DNA-binding ribbon-helix-helix protein